MSRSHCKVAELAGTAHHTPGTEEPLAGPVTCQHTAHRHRALSGKETPPSQNSTALLCPPPSYRHKDRGTFHQQHLLGGTALTGGQALTQTCRRGMWTGYQRDGRATTGPTSCFSTECKDLVR